MKSQSISVICLLLLLSSVESLRTVYFSFSKAKAACMQSPQCNQITSLKGKYYLRNSSIEDDSQWVYSKIRSKPYSKRTEIPLTPLDRPAYIQLRATTLIGKLGHPVYTNLERAL